MNKKNNRNESSIFTRYVRAVAGGDAPSPELFDELWGGLRAAMIGEMRKRSAWSTPPSYLGILGRESWAEGVDGAAEDPLDELLAECFSFIFLRRLGGLARQLTLKPNIDGLVFRAIRNFLHDTQRKHDPLGYRAFEALRAALEALLEDGRLLHPAGGRLRTVSVLSFAPDRPPAASALLAEAVESWAEDLLPELFQATAKARSQVVGHLEQRLTELPSQGIDAFRLGELLQPLKINIRTAWAAQLARDQGASAIDPGEDSQLPVLVVEPESELEDRDAFTKLVDCIERRLRQSTAPPKTQRYLLSLWAYLRAYAAGSSDLEGLREDGRLPSRRRLAQDLGIPRDRLPKLFDTLGEKVETCRAAISNRSPVSRLRGNRSSQLERDRTMNRGVRYDTLRQQAAAAGANSRDMNSAPRSGDQALPGDVLLEPTTAELAVEWVVIDRREDPATLLLVPADDDPLVGSRDFEARSARAPGGLVLRCGFGLWLAPDQLCQASACHHLQERHTAAAVNLWRELETGAHQASVALLEADRDPLYRDRARYELAEARRRLAAAPRLGELRPRPAAAPGGFRHWGKLQLAASLLLVLGGSWWISSRLEMELRERERIEQRWFEDDLPIVSLSGEIYRSAQSPTERVILPTGEPGIKFEIDRLLTLEQRVYNSYQITLTRLGEDPLIRSADLVLSSKGIKLVTRFGREELTPGVYQLVVTARSDSGNQTRLHSQDVLVEFEDSDDD